MMLELAVGDAYGAAFEYVASELVKYNNDLAHYRIHPKFKLGMGRYTDDTQMSLAIAELLVNNVEFTPLNIARKFVEVFKRDVREGYSGKFFDFLLSVRSGEEFLARMDSVSDKSGGAMRASPLGFLKDIEKVKRYSEIQAKLTHNTPLGINAAVASSLMAHYFIYELGERESLGKFIETNVPGEWAKPWQGKVGPQGIESVRAAITAIQQESSLSKILWKCIDFEGDVDTVAAIAMGAASCASEIKKDLPKPLIDGLECSKFGRDYLINLDKQLLLLKNA